MEDLSINRLIALMISWLVLKEALPAGTRPPMKGRQSEPPLTLACTTRAILGRYRLGMYFGNALFWDVALGLWQSRSQLGNGGGAKSLSAIASKVFDTSCTSLMPARIRQLQGAIQARKPGDKSQDKPL